MLLTSRGRALLNIALYAAFIAVAGLAFVHSAEFPRPLLPGYPGPAMFPRLATALMAGCAALGIISEILRLARVGSAVPAGPAPTVVEPSGDDEHEPPVRLGDVAIVTAIMAAFVFAAEYGGMEIGVGLFVTALIYFVTRSVAWAAVAGLASVATVYIVFVQALSVILPLTFLPRYISW